MFGTKSTAEGTRPVLALLVTVRHASQRQGEIKQSLLMKSTMTSMV